MFGLNEHIHPYRTVSYVADDTGYVVWRAGTGGNCELLHLRTYQQRKGYGTALFRRMLEQLRANPPYHSVFGFCLGRNAAAQAFYAAQGFQLEQLGRSVYGGDCTVLFHAPLLSLLTRLGPA